MASSVLTSRTIRGIKYKQGDSFICAYSAKGNGGSEGNGVSAAALTKGDKYYFLGYAVADDSGTTIKYPCKIGSSSSTSSTIGWYPESVFPYATYKITFNANGGSGAPSAQTKTYGTNLTLSSTKPTRTGYTFKGWALSQSEANNGDWYYQSGGTCGKNEDLTLYAVWEEHYLTVNYYSNYATSAFADAENTVGSDKNVKVGHSTIYYDNDYSTYGLANYSGSGGSMYMTRTGYTATGKWGTSTSGGTLVDEDTTFATGQAIAKALGKDLSSGNASINIYAQWQENALTINYYSNYADYGTYDGAKLSVSANSNVVVLTHKYYYDNAYSDGLYNIQNSEKLYLSRTGYSSTLHWGTSTSGGTLIDQATAFSSGQAIAEAVGKSLKTGNASINLYAQWDANSYTYNIVYKSSSGTQLGTATVSKDYGTTNTVNPKSFTGYTSPSSQSIKWDSTSAKTITFTYTPISYDVTINCNGGSGVSSRTYTIETATFTLGTPTRTGYTFSGWTGSNGATAQKTVSISKGSTGDKSYAAQWNEHKLTVNYYSNKADYGTFEGNSLNVGASANVLVHSQEFLYDNKYDNGLSDVQNASYLYLSRIGYKPTGYWGTSVNGGKLVNQSTSFTTGQDLAVALGKTIANGNVSVNVYPQWEPAGIIYIDNGTKFEAYLPYIDNGTSWDLYLAYIDNGTSWNIIS